MKPGDILCLENTRFHKGEEKNDPASSHELAALGDIFVNDAFSAAHRAHASTEGLARKLPAFAGRTMQAELEALARRSMRRSGRWRRSSAAPRSRPSSICSATCSQSRRADHRRRDGEHLPRRAGQAGRQIAVRARSVADSARHSGEGEGRGLRDRAAGRRGGGARSSRPMRPRAWSRSTASAPTR